MIVMKQRHGDATIKMEHSIVKDLQSAVERSCGDAAQRRCSTATAKRSGALARRGVRGTLLWRNDKAKGGSLRVEM